MSDTATERRQTGAREAVRTYVFARPGGLVAAENGMPVSSHVKRAACHVRDERRRVGERLLDRGRERLGSSGSARRAASPAASSIDACEDATTGTPLAIASTIGIPKPSKRDG